MKIFLSEYRHDYHTYTFGYTIYALYQDRSDLNEIYSNGFLPYTGNLNLTHDLYYKSRGIRIHLTAFKDSSENRRVNRKVEPLNIAFELIPINDFHDQQQLLDFAKKYSEVRIGEDKMPEERLQYLLRRNYLTHIITFSTGDKIIGYILAVMTDRLFHFWFSFYDTSYLEQNIPIGKWLMWKCIHMAQDLGLDYIYLGNGYLEKSLYKSRDFNAVEFFDGTSWSTDLKSLHRRCIADNQLEDLDEFKLKSNPNEWLDSLLNKPNNL